MLGTADAVDVRVGAAGPIIDDGVARPTVPELGDDLDELVGARIALVGPACRSWPKFAAAAGAQEVTMFQPTRPPLRWSSDANWRARL